MNELRVAAYAVCVREEQILLARWVARDGVKRWTLPGGGMDHGEDPLETVVREVEEETGYASEVTALLGLHTDVLRRPRKLGADAELHSLRIVYAGRITGGGLRNETDGSTDLACWHPLDAVTGLERVDLVDIGLELWRTRPPVGRVAGNGQ
ncbi:NUDIX hydrolase [Streptomyces sp. NPDC020681]|uniref:NUDIX hydrolase n=1 Tax=Streptomyces sp. NPDC020681 TaxID=3365083 RepID=UPI0037A2A047